MALLKVLRSLADSPFSEAYGLELIRRSGVAAGTFYPILDRLEREGWVISEWEDINESEEGRRKRRYYALTLEGRRQAEALLDEALRALARPEVVTA
jgi:DNA-binding PadR family transcriptional regulator